MTWRNTMARSLGMVPAVITEPQTPMDRMDNMDTTPGGLDSVHSVHIVHSPLPPQIVARAEKAAEQKPMSIPPLNSAECREAFGWPVEQQHVMLAVMAHFICQGQRCLEAELLAFVTVKELARRMGGSVALRRTSSNISSALATWPAGALAEDVRQGSQLIAGGWEAAQAKEPADCIVANHLEIPLLTVVGAGDHVPAPDVEDVVKPSLAPTVTTTDITATKTLEVC